MQRRRIDIGEYDNDVLRLLERRLNQTSHEYTITQTDTGAEVEMSDPGGMDALCTALGMLFLRDISQFELAQMTDKLPLTLIEKQEVLTKSIGCTRSVERLSAARRKLKNYLEDEYELHLSGYMRFRMPEAISAWKLCVQSAMEELLLEKEYIELMRVLQAFVSVKPPRVREMSLLLNPDGSCTLTDDKDARIDYEYCDPDRIVGLLIELAPERLIVYDLTKDQNINLTSMIQNVFKDRVKVIH